MWNKVDKLSELFDLTLPWKVWRLGSDLQIITASSYKIQNVYAMFEVMFTFHTTFKDMFIPCLKSYFHHEKF